MVIIQVWELGVSGCSDRVSTFSPPASNGLRSLKWPITFQTGRRVALEAHVVKWHLWQCYFFYHQKRSHKKPVTRIMASPPNCTQSAAGFVTELESRPVVQPFLLLLPNTPNTSQMNTLVKNDKHTVDLSRMNLDIDILHEHKQSL